MDEQYAATEYWIQSTMSWNQAYNDLFDPYQQLPQDIRTRPPFKYSTGYIPQDRPVQADEPIPELSDIASSVPSTETWNTTSDELHSGRRPPMISSLSNESVPQLNHHIMDPIWYQQDDASTHPNYGSYAPYSYVPSYEPSWHSYSYNWNPYTGYPYTWPHYTLPSQERMPIYMQPGCPVNSQPSGRQYPEIPSEFVEPVGNGGQSEMTLSLPHNDDVPLQVAALPQELEVTVQGSIEALPLPPLPEPITIWTCTVDGCDKSYNQRHKFKYVRRYNLKFGQTFHPDT